MTDRTILVRALAAALVALGALVIAGWLLYVPVLTQLLPGRTSMVANTALCFALQGLALLAASGGRLRLVVGLAVLQGLIAAANLVEFATGLHFAINFPALHRWGDEGNAVPGRMPLSSALSLCATAVATMLLPLRHRGWLRDIARGALVFAFVASLVGLVGQLLQLDLVFRWYPYGRMALHTAIGLLLAVVALRQLWREPRAGSDRNHGIATIGTAALVVVPLLAGSVGILVLKSNAEDALSRSLVIALQARSDALVTALVQAEARAELLAGRPLLTRLLRAQAEAPAGTAASDELRAILDSYLPHGIRRLAVVTPDGRPLVAVGPGDDDTAPVMTPKLGNAGRATLFWRDGFVLRLRHRVADERGEFAELIVDQPLADPRANLFSAQAVSPNAQLLLCGPGRGVATCFASTDGAMTPFETGGELDVPIALGLQGKSGLATVRQAEAAIGLAAYGPVDATGLALLLRIDSAEFYGPIARGLVSGLVLVAVVTGLGVLLLRNAIRQLQQQLALAQQRDRKIVDSLHEGVLVRDGAGRVVSRNRAATRILFDEELEALDDETLERHGLRFIHEDGSEWPGRDRPPQRALRNGRGDSGVVMGLQHRDGRQRWLSVNTALVPEPGAADLPAVVISFEDITEQREADARARVYDQRFRLLVDGITDYGIVMLGTGGVVVSWNAGAERIQGYAASEILGRQFSTFYPRSEVRLGRPAEHLAQVDRDGRFEEEGWRVRKDGSRFWAGVLITAVRGDDGKPLGYCHVLRDLSERRRQEQRLAQAHKFQAAILESAPFAIIATDPSGLICSLNPAAERMLGYAAADLVGTTALDALHDPAEIAAHAAAVGAELGMIIGPGPEGLLARARFIGTDEREWNIRRKDGVWLPVSASVSVLRDENEMISGFLAIAHDITERRRREEIVRHVAHHDFLTGLPNRALLHDRLSMALELARREQQRLAVLMLDLDHFKRVNDTLGHQAGDQLLVAVAERLKACVRSSDTVARLGGDEFVVLLGQLEDVDGVERVASAIIERVSAPILIGGQTLRVTPSIGISRYPEDGSEAEPLLRKADSAMYLAKSEGRRSYRLFDEDLERAARLRSDLESAMRRALQHDEFTLVYQPQVCLATGAPVGVEALLRWNDPVHGAVSPAGFVSVADENGLIVPIGAWGLLQACRDAVRIRERSGLPVRLAVNLSLRQFRQDDLVAMVERALADSGLPGGALEFEIAERVFVAHLDEMSERLKQLRALGVSIAMDNVGAGFPSLVGVTHFPIDTLKIDRSFMRRLPESASDAAVVQAIIALARSVGIRVVAEGVERQEQIAFLHARLGTPADGSGRGAVAGELSVQGYLICEPLPLDRLLAEFGRIADSGRRRIAGLGG